MNTAYITEIPKPDKALYNSPTASVITNGHKSNPFQWIQWYSTLHILLAASIRQCDSISGIQTQSYNKPMPATFYYTSQTRHPVFCQSIILLLTTAQCHSTPSTGKKIRPTTEYNWRDSVLPLKYTTKPIK